MLLPSECNLELSYNMVMALIYDNMQWIEQQNSNYELKLQQKIRNKSFNKRFNTQKYKSRQQHKAPYVKDMNAFTQRSLLQEKLNVSCP